MNRNHKLSQNFLKSPKLAMILVGHTDIKKNDTTLDIGAGSGVFTYALSKKSAQVIAIESDEPTFRKLKNNSAELANVKIFHADVLSYNLNRIPKGYKVCSNIPFHLSSPILTKLLDANNMPYSINLIMQKQLAKKLIDSDKQFTSALGIKLFPFYETKIKKPLRKTDFTPPPAVDTVFFQAKLRSDVFLDKKDQPAFNNFVDEMFHSSDKLKKIKTKFPKIAEKKPSEIPGNTWLEMFELFC